MNRRLSCILLIDDDNATNFLNRKLLEEIGCAKHIQVARSGEEGLAFLKSIGKGNAPTDLKPELIFLDINMPGMSGWDFLEEYKNLPQEQRAKYIILMLTTSINEDDRITAGKYQNLISAFENKPLTKETMTEILDRHF